jgi:glycosyltransferase involved in cell wall biosynthesis
MRYPARLMRIVHVITRLILGGAQQNTIACCAAQIKNGHDVTILYGPIYGPEGSLLNEARATSANLVEEYWMRRSVLPFHDFMSYHTLRKIIRKIKPDVVHTHSSKAGITGRAAAWAEKTPAVIHTIHGLPFHERQFTLTRNTYIAAERWAARRCHRIIGVTQAMCDAFAANRIGRPEQFTVVPSGMDTASFLAPAKARDAVRAELNIPLNAPVLGICARLDKFKGQDDLIRTMPALLRGLPELRLLIVGDGYFRADLDAIAEDLGVKNRVIFTGLVQPARVPELLGAMDIKALPSYQEGQPRTLVQALLCGCAIVGYDAGGIPEVCVDDVTGKLVPVGNREKLAETILRLFAHPDERKSLADRGREYAKAHFDQKIMVDRLEKIYAETLRHSR